MAGLRVKGTETTMVIRLFRGRVKPERLGSLDDILMEVTLPLLENREGLLCYYIGKPLEPNANGFLVLTVWKNLQALKEFTGEDWQKSVVPERMATLLEDSFLDHYSALCETLAHPR